MTTTEAVRRQTIDALTRLDIRRLSACDRRALRRLLTAVCQTADTRPKRNTPPVMSQGAWQKNQSRQE